MNVDFGSQRWEKVGRSPRRDEKNLVLVQVQTGRCRLQVQAQEKGRRVRSAEYGSRKQAGAATRRPQMQRSGGNGNCNRTGGG